MKNIENKQKTYENFLSECKNVVHLHADYYRGDMKMPPIQCVNSDILLAGNAVREALKRDGQEDVSRLKPQATVDRD